jgi:hypothetical protein
MNIGPYLVGVAFWAFLGVSAVAAIVSEHKRRSLTLELLRSSIDKGQALDPALIERLLAKDQRDERLDPEALKLGGIITTFSGVGVIVLSFFIDKVLTNSLYPIMGAGLLAICVGAGLLVGARTLALSRSREQSRAP